MARILPLLCVSAALAACTAFGSDTEPPASSAPDAALPSATVPPTQPLVDASGDASEDAGADASTPPETDAGPPLPAGPACDTTGYAQRLSVDLSGAQPQIDGTAMGTKTPTGSALTVEGCAGAVGKCAKISIDSSTVEFAGFERNLTTAPAPTTAMRLCFHVRVDLDYAKLTPQREWFTLAAVNDAGDPSVAAQLWPKWSDGAWTFIGAMKSTISSTSTLSIPGGSRSGVWHRVQVDASFGMNGRVTVAVDGTIAQAGGAVPQWVSGGVFYFGLRPTPAAPLVATAWYRDVQVGYR